MTTLARRIRALAPVAVASLVFGCAARGRTPDRMLKATLGAAQGVDTATALAVLPLTAGTAGGSAAWFLITESSDSVDAKRRGVNWSPALAALRGGAMVQRGTFAGVRLAVLAGVDFAPTRIVRPLPDSGFPPIDARPGSVAHDGYSPFVELPDGTVLNAPVVAAGTGTLDRVLRLDRSLGFAVVRMSRGYAEGKTAWYISTESSDPMIAAMEGATHAPALARLSAEAGEAAFAEVRLGIVAIVNGPRVTEDRAQQHGLRSALLGEGDPQNILERHPGQRTYTPVWDVHMAAWTTRALREGTRERLLGFNEVLARVEGGLLSAMGGRVAHARLGGLAAAGVIVNCPVVAVF